MRLLLLLLSILVLPLAAQEKLTTVRFLSLPERPETPKLEVLMGEGKTMEVELPSHVLSGKYRLPRLATWHLGATVTNDEGKPVFKSFGSVTPGSGANQLVLILFNGKDPSDGFKALSFDAAKFKGGQFLFMSFFPAETAVEIGGKKFTLQPGGHAIVTPKANRGKRLCFTSLFTRRNGKWRPFFTSNWPIDQKSRGLVFLYQRPGGRVPTLHTIVDHL